MDVSGAPAEELEAFGGLFKGQSMRTASRLARSTSRNASHQYQQQALFDFNEEHDEEDGHEQEHENEHVHVHDQEQGKEHQRQEDVQSHSDSHNSSHAGSRSTTLPGTRDSDVSGSGDGGGGGETRSAAALSAEAALKREMKERRATELLENLVATKDEEADSAISIGMGGHNTAGGGGDGRGSQGNVSSCDPFKVLRAGNMPDFLEMSAPAQLPDEMRPPWLPEDSWVSHGHMPLCTY